MTQWPRLLERAIAGFEALEKQGQPPPYWEMGGGTALMIQLQHRVSKDIDIFIDDPQYLPILSPRLAGESIWDTEAYDEAANYLKLRYQEGEIDFIVAGPISDLKAIKTQLSEDPTFGMRSHEVRLEHTVEIALKKMHYRGSQLKVRDIFDISVIHSVSATLLIDCLHLVSPKKQEILDRLDRIEEGYFELELAELDYFPKWEATAKSSLQTMRMIAAEIPDPNPAAALR